MLYHCAHNWDSLCKADQSLQVMKLQEKGEKERIKNKEEKLVKKNLEIKGIQIIA